jgi:hypothetical protein
MVAGLVVVCAALVMAGMSVRICVSDVMRGRRSKF